MASRKLGQAFPGAHLIRFPELYTTERGEPVLARSARLCITRRRRNLCGRLVPSSAEGRERLLRLRARTPEAPFRVPLYPLVPALFLLVYAALFVGTTVADWKLVALAVGVVGGVWGVGRRTPS